MANGDLLRNLSQGFQSFALNQPLGDIQQRDEVRRLSQSLQESGNIDSPEFQQLAALDPTRATQIGNLFGGIDKRRQQAIFTDAREVRTRLEAGDIQGAAGVVDQRLDILQQLQGDPTDTIEIANLISSGNTTKAINLLKTTERVGIDQGFLKDLRVERKPFQKAEKGLVFDPNTGTFTIDPVAKARFDELAKKSVAAGGLDFKDRQSLNKDVTSILKDTTSINKTAKDLSKLGKLGTGPASIALVFKFMKALDPTSVVREGEFATAEKSAGVPEAIRNTYNRLVSGERLGDVQIKQFINTAQSLSNSAVSSSRDELRTFLDTFEDTLPSTFRQKVEKRIPDLFDLPEQPTITTTTTTPTGAITVGRFTIEVQE